MKPVFGWCGQPLRADHCSPCLVLSLLKNKYELLTYSAKLSFLDAYTYYLCVVLNYIVVPIPISYVYLQSRPLFVLSLHHACYCPSLCLSVLPAL